MVHLFISQDKSVLIFPPFPQECATKLLTRQTALNTIRNYSVRTAMLANTDLRDTASVVEQDVCPWTQAPICKQSEF